MLRLNEEDSKNLAVTTLGTVAFFIFGLSFAGILTSPIKIPNLNQSIEQITMMLIVFYQFGKLSAGVVDRKIKWPGKLPLISISCLFAMLALLLIRPTFDIYGVAITSFVFGASNVLASVTLREHLTKSQNIKTKKVYNAMTAVGWSAGVGCYSFLKNPEFTISLFLTLFLIQAALELKYFMHEDLNSQKKSAEPELRNTPVLAMAPILQMLLVGVLLYSVVVSSLNSSIVNHAKEFYSVGEDYISLILTVPIFGAVLSLLVKNSFIAGFSTITQYLFFKGTGVITVASLFVYPNFYGFIVLLALVGYLTNEETALSYQIISEKAEAQDRRNLHAMAEIMGVLGAFLAWALRYFINDIQSIVSILSLVFASFLIWYFRLLDHKENLHVAARVKRSTK